MKKLKWETLVIWRFFIDKLPEQSRGEVNESDFLESEGECVDDHADEGEEVDGEGGGLVGVSPVEDEAADHGARHAAHHDHQPDQPRVLGHSLGNRRT